MWVLRNVAGSERGFHKQCASPRGMSTNVQHKCACAAHAGVSHAAEPPAKRPGRSRTQRTRFRNAVGTASAAGAKPFWTHSTCSQSRRNSAVSYTVRYTDPPPAAVDYTVASACRAGFDCCPDARSVGSLGSATSNEEGTRCTRAYP